MHALCTPFISHSLHIYLIQSASSRLHLSKAPSPFFHKASYRSMPRRRSHRLQLKLGASHISLIASPWLFPVDPLASLNVLAFHSLGPYTSSFPSSIFQSISGLHLFQVFLGATGISISGDRSWSLTPIHSTSRHKISLSLHTHDG